ncbi:PQ loop repeat protein [Lophiostoma macrostomum CBS 122681]|uniref:PQ loop repeat protein n=1 Tax=Lophiostoma macrostomum CBS 122681 TaxID=1314788 RepID=A0A6A6T753_9PLEO|nr:PQ loop repeat protein [Lophiostoma macrostomum CBS 122681]
MAPQDSIPLAANVLGTIGTVCWCVQLAPQIWRNYRTKTTEGLPATMMFMWSASGVPFGAYAIAQRFNIPLIVQPQCFCVLCGVSWGQCLYYGRKWRALPTTLFLTALFLLFGGIQTGLVFAIQGPYSRGTSWPVTLIGIIAFIMLLAGYVPIPFELIKRRGRVVGIDFVFLAIDWFGAFFSLMSLVAQTEFDALFGSMYAACCAIEMSMVASHLMWALRTRGIRKRARAEGKNFDDFHEAVEWQSKGIDFEDKLMRLVRRGGKEQKEEEGFDRSEIDVESETVNQVVGKGEIRNTVPNGVV